MRYRRITNAEDAMQYTGDNYKNIIQFTDGRAHGLDNYMSVSGYHVSVGDWIVLRPGSRVAVFSDELFKRLYEEVKAAAKCTKDSDHVWYNPLYGNTNRFGCRNCSATKFEGDES